MRLARGPPAPALVRDRAKRQEVNPVQRPIRPPRRALALALLAALVLLGTVFPAGGGRAQAPGPTLEDPRLAVRTVVGGLVTPTSMAFLGRNDFLVLEKNTGKVKRVVNGIVAATVLDLAVNFGSERGLLGIALHPRFPRNPGVYLFWTASTTGADTDVLDQTPLLGNRVDRFVWNGSSLTFHQNLIRLRAIQQDAFTITTPFGTFTQPERGNHDAGVLRFGPDGKLYILSGDVGRRGQLQNLPDGPFGPGAPDDQFGGPEPDNAHLAGVILRLNGDGSTPADNPFFEVGVRSAGRSGRTSKGSSPTASATASAWPSTPRKATSGPRRTARTPSTRSTWWSPASTAAGSRSWGRWRASASSSRSRRRPCTTRTSRTCSSSAGGRSGSPTRRERRSSACSRSRGRSTPTRSSAGSTCSHRRASASWRAGRSGGGTRGTSSSGSLPSTPSTGHSSPSRSMTTSLSFATRGSGTRWPTTS